MAFLDPNGGQTLLRIEQAGPMTGPNATGIELEAGAKGVRAKHPACVEPIPYVKP
jgi:hypothetical protein